MTMGMRSLAVAVCCVALAACGRQSPTVPAHGVITLAGGPWPAEGVLVFEPAPAPASDGAPRLPGTAAFDTEGRFSAKTSAGDEGLFPGRYVIRVECWASEPTMYEPEGKSHVPLKYRNSATSGLEAVVPPGARTVALKFDVPK